MVGCECTFSGAKNIVSSEMSHHIQLVLIDSTEKLTTMTYSYLLCCCLNVVGRSLGCGLNVVFGGGVSYFEVWILAPCF